MDENKLHLHFQFPMPDASREAFIIPNEGSGIRIVEATTWVDELRLYNGTLNITCGGTGSLLIRWPKGKGAPRITDPNNLDVKVTEETDYYAIRVSGDTGGHQISIR
jgi:hypothetical protein